MGSRGCRAACYSPCSAPFDSVDSDHEEDVEASPKEYVCLGEGPMTEDGLPLDWPVALGFQGMDDFESSDDGETIAKEAKLVPPPPPQLPQKAKPLLAPDACALDLDAGIAHFLLHERGGSHA